MADPSETTQITSSPDEIDAAELLSAVRALSAQVVGLQAELQALREQTAALPAGDTPGWDEHTVASRESPAWVRSLDTPGTRRLAAPRLVLEIAFLAAVAVLAAVADFGVAATILVMAGAWLLVALAEWTGARSERLRADALEASVSTLGASFADDPSWYAPPVERTVLESVESGEDTGALAKLPPPPEE